MLPGLVFYLVYRYFPIYGIVIAFKKVSPFSGSYYFWNVLRNTILLSVYRLVCAVPLTLSLALLLSEVRNTAFKRIAQTISYLPHFISMVVYSASEPSDLHRNSGSMPSRT